jgi:hypothetical protein
MRSTKTAAMGRRNEDLIDMPGRYPRGTRERISAVLEPGERQAEFLRLAVEKELRRRERVKRRKKIMPCL